MFSITVKRSAATLGVVAGLLAAAAPANAQFWQGLSLTSQAPIKAGTQVGHEGRGAGASFTLDVASSEVFELNTFGLAEHEGAAFRGEVTGLEPNALGTQVGSEGVKAPKPPASSEEPSESISFNSLKAAGTETGNPERSGPASPTSLVFTSVSNVAPAVVGGVVPGGAIISA